MKDVSASHGKKDLITSKATTMAMTINEETNKSGKEFEYHAHRDHVFQVLDGETKYELGGTPKNARQTGPGEWLAPESEGFKTVMLKKGDYLSIPRMTPHRRVTEKSVTLLLIAAQS
jgi:mannose-6-phosphate isomerase-like protein (cupin superfamily)